VLIGAVDVHDKDVIALHGLARGLENKLLAVAGEVSFGILSAEGELANAAEMLLLGSRLGCLGESCYHDGGRECQRKKELENHEICSLRKFR